MTAKKKEKVIIIGLDGVSYKVIQPWLKKGYLPTIKSILDGGRLVMHNSVTPPISPSAWTSLVTGVNPGKHGIFDFLVREPQNYIFSPVNRILCKYKSVWKLLDESGVRVIVYNIPFSYPPEKFENGIHITGWFTPAGREDYIWPHDVRKLFKDRFPKYYSYPKECYTQANEGKFMREAYSFLNMNTDIIKFLLSEYEWDVFAGVIFDTDRVLHELWHYLDDTHSWYRDGREYVVRDYFCAVDSSIKQILSLIPGEKTVIIVSDHGFGSVERYINLNSWFLKKGLMKVKKDFFPMIKFLSGKLGFNLVNIHRFFEKIEFAGFIENNNADMRHIHLLRKIFLSFSDIDWKKTLAYSFGRHLAFVNLNLRGREPCGIINYEEYDYFVDKIKKTLLEFVDKSGKRVIGNIFKRDEVWKGADILDAPDLIIYPNDEKDYFLGLVDFPSLEPIRSAYRYSGIHRPDGMFIFSGKRINTNSEPLKADIYDFAPTLLYLTGIPIPESMEGKILNGLFSQKFLHRYIPEFSHKTHKKGEKKNTSEYTFQEKEEIKQRLRNLGYLE